jgi:hypothetical protein
MEETITHLGVLIKGRSDAECHIKQNTKSQLIQQAVVDVATVHLRIGQISIDIAATPIGRGVGLPPLEQLYVVVVSCVSVTN